jgi:hypothetical protein
LKAQRENDKVDQVDKAKGDFINAQEDHEALARQLTQAKKDRDVDKAKQLHNDLQRVTELGGKIKATLFRRTSDLSEEQRESAAELDIISQLMSLSTRQPVSPKEAALSQRITELAAQPSVPTSELPLYEELERLGVEQPASAEELKLRERLQELTLNPPTPPPSLAEAPSVRSSQRARQVLSLGTMVEVELNNAAVLTIIDALFENNDFDGVSWVQKLGEDVNACLSNDDYLKLSEADAMDDAAKDATATVTEDTDHAAQEEHDLIELLGMARTGEFGDLDFLACANSVATVVLIVAGLSAQGEKNETAVTAVWVLVLAFVFITNFLVFLRVRAMAKQASVELSEEAGKRASQQGSGALSAALAAITGICSCFSASGACKKVSNEAERGVQLQVNRLSPAFSFSDQSEWLQQTDQQEGQGSQQPQHGDLLHGHADAGDDGPHH